MEIWHAVESAVAFGLKPLYERIFEFTCARVWLVTVHASHDVFYRVRHKPGISHVFVAVAILPGGCAC